MFINQSNLIYLNEQLGALNNTISALNAKSSMLSTLRAVSFFLGAALLIMGIADGIVPAGISGGALLVFFLFLVKYHEKISNTLEQALCKRESVEHYIMRFSDDYKKLPDDGSEYLSTEDTVACDLDLLGHASVYQLINVCHTGEGKKKLAEGLKSNQLADDICDINEAVLELSMDLDGALSFESLGISGEKNKRNKGGKLFFEFCGNEGLRLPSAVRILSILFPVIMLIFVVLWIAGVTHYGYALVGFLIMLGYSEATRGITDAITAPMLTASVITKDYITMLGLMSDTDYKSAKLKTIKEKAGGKNGILEAFRKLDTISEAYRFLFNPAIYIVLNGLFLWNYRLAGAALRWRAKYGENALGCADVIADMEYLRSLAVIGIVKECSYAQIDEAAKTVDISFDALYHPLITPSKVVANSADITSGISIITGSNMSGKTTFLRTIAVNLVLAYMGAPVCAKRLEAGYMKIFTSMRISDDVANGISTFYAEILRIKAMADYRKENKPMICMVDEIFKGTNSADRIVGATEAIRRLSGANSIAMISTHDFELCTINDSEGNEARNYHFEEYYEDDTLMFDYKLKSGRCTTTNARALLRMAGFTV